MKHSENKEIQVKIKALFAYRHLTDLFQYCGLTPDHSFVNDLIELQFQIYLLDAYLESAWTLDNSKLDELWANINSALKPFNFSDKKTHKLLREIRNYQRIETDCRLGKWPVEVSFEKFYTTKSCDVRLIRHLLYAKHPALNLFCDEKSWVYYDLITEINDDISDVYEDMQTHNGNRFLISILRKGHLPTERSYRKYLSQVAYNASSYFKTKQLIGENAQLFEWTTDRAVETMDLLQATIESLDHTRCTTSTLLDKMK